MAKVFNYLINIGLMALRTAAITSGTLGFMIIEISKMAALAFICYYVNMLKEMVIEYIEDGYSELYHQLLIIGIKIRNSYKECNKDDDPPTPMHTRSAEAPITPIIDPSGYVYEAVSSNRLEDVMATVSSSGGY